jgi:HK97 gp10 family phage protein
MSIDVTIKMDGDREIMRMLAGWNPVSQRRIVRPGVSRGARLVSRTARANAPVESGLLRKSIGVVVKTYKDGTVVGVVGPRHGFKRAVAGSGKSSKIVTRKNVGDFSNSRISLRNPVKYAHLVHGGTRPHAVGSGSKIVRSKFVKLAKVTTGSGGVRAKRTYAVSPGKQTGKMHPGSPANPFLDRAWRSSAGAVRAIMVQEVRKNVRKEAMRLLRKKGLAA